MNLRKFALSALIAIPFAARAADDLPLKEQLEQIRAAHHLPALAILMEQDGKVVARASTGVRKLGSDVPVTDDDQWHIGSCTKSMTATLAAMLVQQGKLKWDTTVLDVFPEWGNEMSPEWRGVTLEELLTHRSGVSKIVPPELWAEAWKEIGTPTQQRLVFVHGLVTRPVEAPPGTEFIYSNQNYAIAGAMIERVTGRPWEELIRTMLFEPLGMKSAGFGAPATPGQIDQPWGHTTDLKPVPPGKNADNPPAIAPAAAVHCSLEDLATYCLMHARGEVSGAPFLNAAYFVKLHTPPAGQDYAMGWIVTKRDWAGGTALNHVGSNTMFLTDIWIAPQKDAVLIAATNTAGDEASQAADQAIGMMIQRYLAAPN